MKTEIFRRMVISPMGIWMSAPALILLPHVPASFAFYDLLDLVSYWVFQTALGLWVVRDSSERRRPPCYDCDWFIFMAAPFILPVYLFQTRRWWSILILLGFFTYITTLGYGAHLAFQDQHPPTR